MIQKNDQPAEQPQTFMITVVPTSNWIPTDNIESKVRLMVSGCGLDLRALERVKNGEQDDEK